MENKKQTEEVYDVLILTTPNDFKRVQKHYIKLLHYIPMGNLIFVGNEEVGQLVEEELLKKDFSEEKNCGDLELKNCGDLELKNCDDSERLKANVLFFNEEELIPFEAVNQVMKNCLGRDDVPRGITGWYYQQFLKLQYAYISENPYYMTWDGDTLPCKEFSIKKKDQLPYFDVKKEYHEEYFTTMHRLISSLEKCIEESFISEHMLFCCDYVKELLDMIMQNQSLSGETFYEKILKAIPKEKLPMNSFSEFETYGTYVAKFHPEAYKIRRWHSFRHCGDFFHPETISEEDFEWLAKDFDAVSFEKGSFVREDNEEIFTKKEYRAKLSARQILEIVQEEYLDGYKETWD